MVTLVVPTDAPKVQGPPQGQWTRADWDALPDDGNRYEIIEGVLFMSTAPSVFHQYILMQFVRFVGVPAIEQGRAQVFFSPIGVFMPGCEPVQPDLVIVLQQRAAIIHDRRIYGVPDLIVEVISPGSRDYDEDVKLKAYAAAGVPEYAVIDPEARQLRLYALESARQYGAARVFNEADSAAFACLPAISFRVGSLFEGAPDTTL
ncbi:MAG: Uma2 family endonuclease [Chloroflexi bacterium]|nr:Uma2 family endonuclease [Chloroflexota bacterium]